MITAIASGVSFHFDQLYFFIRFEDSHLAAAAHAIKHSRALGARGALFAFVTSADRSRPMDVRTQQVAIGNANHRKANERAHSFSHFRGAAKHLEWHRPLARRGLRIAVETLQRIRKRKIVFVYSLPREPKANGTTQSTHKDANLHWMIPVAFCFLRVARSKPNKRAAGERTRNNSAS